MLGGLAEERLNLALPANPISPPERDKKSLQVPFFPKRPAVSWIRVRNHISAFPASRNAQYAASHTERYKNSESSRTKRAVWKTLAIITKHAIQGDWTKLQQCSPGEGRGRT